MNPILRSILAVVAGYLVMALIVSLTTFVATQLLLPPSSALTTPYLVINLVMGIVAACVGGYVTGVLAQRSVLIHAGALALLVIFMGFLAAVLVGLSAGGSFEDGMIQPMWYQFVITLVGGAGAFVGGYIREQQRQLEQNEAAKPPQS